MGYTFPRAVSLLTTPSIFAGEPGVAYRALFSDPDEWATCSRLLETMARAGGVRVSRAAGSQPTKRCSTRLVTGSAPPEIFPKRGTYKIFHPQHLSVHQRVADALRVGRVFSCGRLRAMSTIRSAASDSLRIHDAIRSSDKLAHALSGTAAPDILDRYDATRRRSISNMCNSRPLPTRNGSRKDSDAAAPRIRIYANVGRPTEHRNFLMRTSLLESVRKIAV